MTTLPLVQNILDANDRIAAENARLFADKGVFTVNLMGGPGAGKTTLLEQTAKRLKPEVRWGVIEGDVEGSADAERLERAGVPCVQINTGGACHLDGNMVREALPHLPLDELDLLVVENVGNLVCPAEFKMGENHKVMVLSTAEGDDKPRKYPLMFRESSVLLLSKMDLVPYVEFDEERLRAAVRDVNPDLTILPISSRTGQGLEAWIEWLEQCLSKSQR